MITLEQPDSRIDAAWLARQFSGGSAREIENAMLDLVRKGRLPAGARLPTIRDLAEELDISPASIADAWKHLRAAGVIETRRRGGTFIHNTLAAAGRHAQTGAIRDEGRGGKEGDGQGASGGASNAWAAVDLMGGTADPRLLPPIQKALARAARAPRLHEPYKEYIIDSLRAAAGQSWPFPAEAWTAGGGGTETALLAFQAAAPAGSVVAVETPTSPRILYALDEIRVHPVPVACDREGPLPDALENALRSRPAAFIYQPRAQVPLGHAVSQGRLAELAQTLLRHGPDVWVVEDDNTGPVASAAPASMGALLPERVLHVRSYCKSYGLDLRTAVAAGVPELIRRMQNLRTFGVAMTSRLLQEAMAYLITNAETSAAIARSRETYAARRRMLQHALRARGLDCANDDGVNLWLPVPDESRSLVNLAVYGVNVGAGSRCFVGPPPHGYLRIATSHLHDDEQLVEQLADLVAAAVNGSAREMFD